MRIKIAAIGRSPKGAAETQAALNYLQMAEQLGRSLGIGPLSLHELEDRTGRTGAGTADRVKRKQREGALLLAESADALMVALDGRGKVQSSEEFAAWIGQVRDQGCRCLAFVIGGADGLDDAVLARAQKSLSLGAMTWPHMLARMMLAEQIYRSVSILANHPYHRGG